MQTGQWLNLKRNNNYTVQILSLFTVCAVSIPILALTLLGAIIYRIIHKLFVCTNNKAP